MFLLPACCRTAVVAACVGLGLVSGSDAARADLFAAPDPSRPAVLVSLDGRQPLETLRMVERLSAVARNVDPTATKFFSDLNVALLRKKLDATTNENERLHLQVELGVELTRDGQTEAALAEFQNAEATAVRGGIEIDARGRMGLRMRRITALLRLGEQENCLVNHLGESCLFPLRRGGVHVLPRGSRGALTLLQEQLTEVPDDLSARWLLNLAHMTLGEYPDRVPAQFLIPPKIFESEYPLPQFPEVAGALGLDVNDQAGGVVMDDFDNDGLLDLVVSAWGLRGQIRFFRNTGDGRFVERTREAGLIGIYGGLNLLQADYNNDGWVDVLVLRGAWMGKVGRMPNSLLRNNGDGTFTDVTESAGVLSDHPTQTAVWFDYNGDGALDLFVGNETTDPAEPELCELFRNLGNGTFAEVARESGLRVAVFVKGVTAGDYDNDGRPDLYLSCRDSANILLHNVGPDSLPPVGSGEWRFSNTALRAGVTGPEFSFPTWFFDYDNDGWEDLFVSGYWIRNVGDIAADYLGQPGEAVQPKLYHNNRDGTFSDVTVEAHLNRVCHTMGCNFGDLDNDGWLDFYAATGDPDILTLIPNRMFRNAGGKTFQEVTTATGTGHLQKGHGVSIGDLDNDGDQDVYAVMGGAYTGDNYQNAFFLNPGAGGTNRWLKLKLEGTQSNRSAIGARIRVAIETPNGPRNIYKTVNSGGSFGANPLRQEIGLANATAIREVKVWWPTSGKRQVFGPLESNRCYRIREGDPKAVTVPLAPISFDLTQKHSHRQAAPRQP